MPENGVLTAGDNFLFADEIRDAARTTQVPAALIKAVIQAESSWRARAVRIEPGDASYGLMQVLGATAGRLSYKGEIGPTDPSVFGRLADNGLPGIYNPRDNILLGARVLAEALRSSGQLLAGAISAYNGGWRPDLGFGQVNTRAGLSICLARDATGKCVSSRVVPVGEFSNQAYVDKVMSYFKAYGGRIDASGRPVPDMPDFSDVVGGASSGPLLPPKPEIPDIDLAGVTADLGEQLKPILGDLNTKLDQTHEGASKAIYVAIVLAIIAALTLIAGRKF